MKKILFYLFLFILALSAMKSCGDDTKSTASNHGPEETVFALKCYQDSNNIHKLYFVLTNKSAYETNGKEGVSKPVLVGTNEKSYIFKDVQWVYTSRFDRVISVYRQDLKISTQTEGPIGGKSPEVFMTTYTCEQQDPEAGMAIVNEVIKRDAEKSEAEKAELRKNQKI